MYVRKATRRRFFRASFIVLALVLMAPKLELSEVPQLSAVLIAVGLETPRAS